MKRELTRKKYLSVNQYDKLNKRIENVAGVWKKLITFERTLNEIISEVLALRKENKLIARDIEMLKVKLRNSPKKIYGKK